MIAGSLEQYGSVFIALADPNRRAVLERLARSGEESASSIAQAMPISRQAVIKHLAQLDRADLVRSRRRGKEVLFAVHPESLIRTANALEQIAVGWDRRLLALKQIAEGSEEGRGRREEE